MTMINRRRFSQSLTSMALSGYASRALAQSDKIVLGQSATFSGLTAQLGLQFNAGAKLAFDQTNATGGVGGRMVELLSMDDGYEPAKCVENTKKLIDADVFAMFGFVGTPTCVAALPSILKARVPFFGPLTGAMALRNPFNRQVFHVRASYNDETAVIVKQLTTLGLTRIAVFHQNDAYGTSGLDGVRLAMSELNLEPVVTGTVERNSVDVAKAVQVINAAKPEAVVQISTYKASAAFIRASRAAGYGGLFYNVSFAGTQALSDELGAAAAGVVVTQVVPSPFSLTQPITREFIEAIRREGSSVRANYLSLEGYIAAKVLLEGLHRAGNRVTRESLVTALESIADWNMGGFKVTYSRSDHVASNRVEVSVLTGDGRVRT